jgi:hypothetical protein
MPESILPAQESVAWPLQSTTEARTKRAVQEGLMPYHRLIDWDEYYRVQEAREALPGHLFPREPEPDYAPDSDDGRSYTFYCKLMTCVQR